ncbi:hypothetical protein Tco_0943447, partial [Tanacetum coccineum]
MLLMMMSHWHRSSEVRNTMSKSVPKIGCIVFDVEEDEDEAKNKNPWEFDDEDEFDNEVADEDEVDDEDEWL